MSNFDNKSLIRQKELINLHESNKYSWRDELNEGSDHPYVDVMPKEKTGDEKEDKKDKKDKKKDKVEEGYKPTPFEKMERQSGKAYQKEQDAVRKGDEGEVNKQMQRRLAMKSPLNRRTQLINQGKGPANEKTRRIKEELSLTPNTDFRLDEDAVSSGALDAVKNSLPKGSLIDTTKKKKETPWQQKHMRKDPDPKRYDKKND